ncbi:rhodanese-like domain-containing protein [Geobacter pelophilus]|uniref:Rhodanese-like domain-containing protein n=1 Tax=Geoanaerobacter pelophilus TaxID=60036 RepID=A0AAW4L7B4_9BACT|nr:rhodanese-like domain-containing protein [Geoanaerobacter pelophilus]MBT0664176.1 rhodanese-like domain-containing protein [Geoanaerobacter pelophilus]
MTIRSLKTSVFALLTALSLCSMAMAAASGATQPKQQAVSSDKSVLDEVLPASNAYFNRFPFMRAEDVFDKIVTAGDQSFLLVSVQSPDEYARGHVPGAINIPLPELANEQSLKRLSRDKKLVFTCDNGHRSMAAALFLGQLGYETYAMSMGLSYWNGPESGIASPYPGSAGYPVSTVTATTQESHVPPVIAGNNTNGQEAIIERTRAVLANERNLFIDRKEVYDKAVKGGDKGYLLVSLQRPGDYAKGHVPGAINIPASDIAKLESLRKLPRDKKIVLICYVGHWGGSAALFLRQLGYEAYDMRFGTLGWNNATEGLGEAKGYLVALEKTLNLPVEKGTLKR